MVLVLRLCCFIFMIALSAVLLRAQTDLLAGLTLEQKVAQMFMVSVYGPLPNEAGRAFLQRYQPGSLALFNSNAGTPEAVTAFTNAAQSAVVSSGGLPMLIAVDQEGGVIARLKDGFTEWPVPMLVTATGDLRIAYRVGQALAAELLAVGINMNLAPVADLNTNINNPVIGRRSYGTDPELTGQIVAAVTRGMQDAGVVATAKHFPGHGDTSVDSHTQLPIVEFDRDRLDKIELAPFRWTVAAGIETVMMAHIWLPALEPQQNLPASLSYNVVTGLLRQEWGYDGLIMTDALEMDAIDTVYSYGTAALMAVQAGNDVIAFGAHLTIEQQANAIDTVLAAVRSGMITEARIDESVRRILDVKQRYGILDWQPLDPAGARQRIDFEAHSALVQELFFAGTTVAYDRHNHVPVSAEKTAAIIYPVNRQQIYHQCSLYKNTVRWVGVSNSPTEDEITWAVDAAKRVDTVIVFTQNAFADPQQQQLVRRLPPEKTVAVALWSPYDWMTYSGVGAFIATYSPLSPGAEAASCAILFGAAPARGQLAVELGPQLPAGRRGS